MIQKIIKSVNFPFMKQKLLKKCENFFKNELKLDPQDLGYKIDWVGEIDERLI